MSAGALPDATEESDRLETLRRFDGTTSFFLECLSQVEGRLRQADIDLRMQGSTPFLIERDLTDAIGCAENLAQHVRQHLTDARRIVKERGWSKDKRLKAEIEDVEALSGEVGRVRFDIEKLRTEVGQKAREIKVGPKDPYPPGGQPSLGKAILALAFLVTKLFESEKKVHEKRRRER